MNVIVTGLPGTIKFPKLVGILRKVLSKEGIESSMSKQGFWIRELSDIPGTNLKEMTIELNSHYDAQIAQNILNDYMFCMNNEEYLLVARIDNRFSRHRTKSPSPYRYRERSRESFRSDRYYNRRYSRDRSRSPVFRSEVSKLDLEIELLRKQRQVIEEERRLLLERKKLDLIKEFGPCATKEFAVLNETRRFDREVRKPRRPSPPKPKRMPKKQHADLPQFVLPCRKLIDGMRPLISQHSSSKKEFNILIKLIRKTLRKRIAVALEDKDYMNTTQIVELYKRLYSPTTDEDLVKKLVKNIKENYLPYEKANLQKKGGPQEKCEENDAGSAIACNIKEESNESSGAEDTDNNIKAIKFEKREDTDAEITNEYAVSLDATEVELMLEEDKDWVQGGSDWNDIQDEHEE